MKKRIFAAVLSFVLTIGSINLFSGYIINAENDDSDSKIQTSNYVYERFIKEKNAMDVDESLFERYLKYSFGLNEASVISNEKLELCKYVFDTERSDMPNVYCMSARQAINGSAQKRASFDEPETISYIVDAETISENSLYFSGEPEIYPDIVYSDYYVLCANEYWLDDKGTERLIFSSDFSNEYFEYIKIYEKMPSDIENADNVFISEDGKSFIKYELVSKADYAKKSVPEKKSSDIWEYEILANGTAVLTGCSLPKQNEMVPVNEVLELPSELDGYKVCGIDKALDLTGVTRLVIPENYSYIGHFTGMKYLESVEVNAPHTILGDAVFMNCPALKYAKINVKDISGRIFVECPELTTIDIQNTYKIGVEAFANLPKLSEVNLPKKLQYIGQDAFKNTSLTEIIIPENIDSVGVFRNPYLSSEGVVDPFSSVESVRIADEACTIVSNYSSEGHAYAMYNNIKFSPLDNLIYGDANNDGSINSLDLISLKQHLFGVKDSGYESDVNMDGRINILDYISLKHVILQ